MLKNIVKYELKIGEKLYTAYLENDSPLNDVKEFLFQFTKFIGGIEENIKSQQTAQAEQKSPENKVESIPENS